MSGNASVGGLVGGNRETITASYATVAVSGVGAVGGLVGDNLGTITASYATGTVSGGDSVGGLVGYNGEGRIEASYATGAVSGSDEVGGLVGGSFRAADITNSYWDTTTSGQSISYGGVGKTTSELQSPTDYTGIYADWNLDLDGDGTEDDPWDFGNSSEYPVIDYVPSVPTPPTPTPTPPGAPAIGAVTSGTDSLTVSWTAPSSDGGSAITAYDLRHIETSADESDDSNWTVVNDVWTAGGGTLQYTLIGLAGATQYDLQIRAVNAGGDGSWSETGTGTPTTSSTCVTEGAVADATNRGLASDCEALLAWRDTLAGTATLNWSADTPIADWDGIGDDSLEGSPTRVIRLYLNRLRLDGMIPSGLSNLTELRALYLHDNELTGTVPSSLGDLSNLIYLYAHNNDLTGEIPAKLGELASLKGVSLHSNDLTGGIPAEIGQADKPDQPVAA